MDGHEPELAVGSNATWRRFCFGARGLGFEGLGSQGLGFLGSGCRVYGLEAVANAVTKGPGIYTAHTWGPNEISYNDFTAQVYTI